MCGRQDVVLLLFGIENGLTSLLYLFLLRGAPQCSILPPLGYLMENLPRHIFTKTYTLTYTWLYLLLYIQSLNIGIHFTSRSVRKAHLPVRGSYIINGGISFSQSMNFLYLPFDYLPHRPLFFVRACYSKRRHSTCSSILCVCMCVHTRANM